MPLPRRSHHVPVHLRLCALLALALLAGEAAALEKLTLQLSGKHQFQFAGVYAAQEKGFFREAGLEVHLLELAGADPAMPVLAGKAAYGIGDSTLLLTRSRGEPVVVLASLFQHAPALLMVRSGAPGPAQLQAIRRVMLAPHSVELLAYLKKNGAPLDQLQQLPPSGNPDDLAAGRVDAMSTLVTDPPFLTGSGSGSGAGSVAGSGSGFGFGFELLSPRADGIGFHQRRRLAGLVQQVLAPQAHRIAGPDQVHHFDLVRQRVAPSAQQGRAGGGGARRVVAQVGLRGEQQGAG
ncbi:MAG: ABC transporter substrate-binding protein, partial [Massilia sp.]|nr:ABC transporter substrate-binding protein [Massilia sp.]